MAINFWNKVSPPQRLITSGCKCHVVSVPVSVSASVSTLLSDAQVEHYAAIFLALNEQYSLIKHHHFTFEDFLDDPETFEINIHRYFANKSLFEQRRGGGKVHLHLFFNHPAIMMAAVSVEEAYREAESVKCEQLLPKQLKAICKIDLTEMEWFQELIMHTFENHHRVLMRGNNYVEPNTHYHRCERKRAGGKR